LFPFFPFFFKCFFLTFFFFQPKEKKKKTKKKNHREGKKMQRREGIFLQAFTLPSHFWLPLLPLLFQMLFPGIFFFSSRRKKKQHKEKKTHRKYLKIQRRDGAFFKTFTLHSHFWLSLLPSHFCPFVSNIFSRHLLLLKQKKRKEKHKEKNICREGREFSFKLPLYRLTFGSCFCPFILNIFSLASSYFKAKYK